MAALNNFRLVCSKSITYSKGNEIFTCYAFHTGNYVWQWDESNSSALCKIIDVHWVGWAIKNCFLFFEKIFKKFVEILLIPCKLLQLSFELFQPTSEIVNQTDKIINIIHLNISWMHKSLLTKLLDLLATHY